ALLQHAQVLLAADLQNGLGIRRELLHPSPRISQYMALGLFPVVHVAVHRGGADALGLPALMHDQSAELERAVNIENTFTVLEAKQPLPVALGPKQLTQVGSALVGIDTAGHDHAQPPLGA